MPATPAPSTTTRIPRPEFGGSAGMPAKAGAGSTPIAAIGAQAAAAPPARPTAWMKLRRVSGARIVVPPGERRRAVAPPVRRRAASGHAPGEDALLHVEPVLGLVP